jgi:hypothetical protein
LIALAGSSSAGIDEKIGKIKILVETSAVLDVLLAHDE